MEVIESPMRHPLLTLVVLCLQVLSLIGPGVIICRDQQGRVCFEFVGQSCMCSLPPAPQVPSADSTACGCGHAHPDTDQDTTPPCDCEHTPLAERADRPCILPVSVTVDPPATLAQLWTLDAPLLQLNAGDSEWLSGPAGSGPPHSAHLSQLAGVVLRC